VETPLVDRIAELIGQEQPGEVFVDDVDIDLARMLIEINRIDGLESDSTLFAIARAEPSDFGKIRGDAGPDAVPPDRLIAAAAEGYQEAWKGLVERYTPLVHSVASRVGVNWVDIDDVSQMVWIRAVEALPRLRKADMWVGWLATATLRESQRFMKRSLKARMDDPKVSYEIDEDAIEQVEQGFEQVEQRSVLLPAIAKLSQPHQAVMMLMLVEPSLSIVEVGRRLDMSNAAVLASRERALARLRFLLAQEQLGR
jgi:RNA polymerase sigma factor (sigma-70 family)